MRTSPWAMRLLVLVMIALAAGACAAGRAARAGAATPIDSVASIAGVWTGTLDFGAGEQACTLTIESTGRAVLQGSTVTLNGTVAVQGGKGTYSFPGRSDGAMTLYREGGKRELQLRGQSGALDVWVTPR